MDNLWLDRIEKCREEDRINDMDSLWISHPIDENMEGRKRDRKFAMTRAALLLERLPDEEYLRDELLSDNNFEGSCMMKRWVERDEQELEEIEVFLDRLEAIDGPPTEEEIQEVHQRLQELQEEAEKEFGKGD